MFYWSLKTLLSEPIRLIASAMAVAVSFVLVIFFSAVFEGESNQMVAYLEKMDADVWVMQKGVSNMHMASSMVWDWKADRIAQIKGVKAVSAILYLNGPVNIGGKDWFSYIIGVSPEYRNAGPWSVIQGKFLPDVGEVVIPEVISRLTGVQIGENVILIDRPLRVVGLSRGTFSMASSVVFVSREDLGDLLEAGDQYSYIMVYADPDVTAQYLIERIEDEVDKVNALSNGEFIESDRQLALQMGAEIINMMTILGTIMATLIVAFTAYSVIARKKQELAIAKALGFGNGQIYMAVLYQSVTITLLGLFLAMGCAFTLLAWLPSVIPQIILEVGFNQFIPLVMVSLPVAIMASLAAAYTVTRLDPMIVFSGQ